MYNKLFQKILDSSIWLCDIETRLVWVTLLVAMDRTGFAQFAAIENLALRARVSLPKTKAAVEILSSPDSSSSDPEFEGRRIERVPGGFIILNATKYNSVKNIEHQREMNRERVRRYRERQRESQKQSKK